MPQNVLLGAFCTMATVSISKNVFFFKFSLLIAVIASYCYFSLLFKTERISIVLSLLRREEQNWWRAFLIGILSGNRKKEINCIKMCLVKNDTEIQRAKRRED